MADETTPAAEEKPSETTTRRKTADAAPKPVEHREVYGELALVLKTGQGVACSPPVEGEELDFYTHVEASLVNVADGSVLQPDQVSDLAYFEPFWDGGSSAKYLAADVVEMLREAFRARLAATAEQSLATPA